MSDPDDHGSSPDVAIVGGRTPDVAVVGAGAIGIATALELAQRGAAVTVLERGPRPASGSSFGNAGIVGPAHVLPLASGQAVRDGLRWMLRRDSPFSLTPRPAAIPWLARFLLAARASRYERSLALLQRLAAESAALHRALDQRFDTGVVERGFLEVYETERGFEAARAHRLPDAEVLDGAATRELCPQLAATPAGGLFAPGEAHCDPAQLVTTLADAAVEAGVTLRMGVEVHGVRRRPGGEVLWTSAGEIPAGTVVIAAGAWSPSLAAGLGLRLPFQGGKGYHVDFEPGDGDTPMPLWFAERRTVATPLPRGLRLTGMLQLAGTDLSIDHRRVDTILANGRRLLTGLADRRITSVWRGLRPCSPDGIPIVGRAPSAESVVVATGHGMWGLQLAPVTARLVTDLIVDGRGDEAVLDALTPARFKKLPA